MNRIVCRTCNGTGKIFAFFLNYGEGNEDKPTHGVIGCHDCNGSGFVDRDLIPDEAEAARLRDYLLNNEITLRQASLSSGINVMRLSAFENLKMVDKDEQEKIINWLNAQKEEEK